MLDARRPRHCCYIYPSGLGCGMRAEYMVIDTAVPLEFLRDEYTDTCAAHLHLMLTDAPESRVRPIEQEFHYD
jgi:hypothetical protein